MAKLSIIIPALGAAEEMEEGLVSVLQHRPADAEVVVVLGRPYADPYDLADEVRFVRGSRRGGLPAALQLGLSESSGEIVHFLRAGSTVAENWCEAALAAFQEPAVAAASPLVFDAEQAATSPMQGVVYLAGGRRRAEFLGADGEPGEILGPMMDAAFYRRGPLVSVGGPAGGLGDDLIDVDLALALRAAGYQAALAVDSHVTLTSAVATKISATRRGLYAQRLYRRNRALAAEAGNHLIASLEQPTQWVGRLLGQLGGAPQRQQMRLAALAARGAEGPDTVPFEAAPLERDTSPELRRSA